MRLVRCDACGAKAILAASQCPKCAEQLYVRNDRGDEVRLVSCRSCATWYPASRDGCRWCPAVTRSSMPGRAGKVVAAMLTIAAAWGGWQLLPASSATAVSPNVTTLPPETVPRLTPVAVFPSSVERPSKPAKTLRQTGVDTRSRETTKPEPAATVSSAAGELARTAPEEPGRSRTDSMPDLVSARAITWVNVRAEANGTSAIVGMVLPDSVVELGETRRGWRRVSTRWFSGWASARLFSVDSLGR